MTTKSMFPSNLLDAGIDERVDYFNTIAIRHPIFKDVGDALLDAVLSSEKEPLIFVIGPSHVGKSTLIKWLEKQMRTILNPFLEKYPERLPFASVEAIAPGYGNFKWNDYYARSLRELKEPLIDKKVLYAEEKGFAKCGSRGSTAALRRSLENALGYRKPGAFIIDEAQHLARVGKGKLEEQLDCIKSLANLTKVKHVFFGTYELLEFRDKSGQLNNRSRDIHFPRYDATNAEDFKKFKMVVATFQAYAPLTETPDLVQHSNFLYERTIGCIGILNLWIARALRESLKKGGNTITLKDLERTALATKKTIKLASEALKGEEKMTDDPLKRDVLLRLIGLTESNSTDSATPKTTKKGNQHPGQQDPHRYAVGIKSGSSDDNIQNIT